jgi:hypothetical protein
VSTSSDTAETFRFVGSDAGTGIDLVLDLRDVYPQLSASAEHRLGVFAERAVGVAISTLVDAASSALAQAGYLRDA